MDEDGLELQPQEPHSFFDPTGITTRVVTFSNYQIWNWLQVDELLDSGTDIHT